VPTLFCAMIAAAMNEPRDLRSIPSQPPTLNRVFTPPALDAAPRSATPGQECCDRCGSIRLIRVKACWRCENCGYKSDCNGW
jgi:hypothetical protein